MSFKFLNTIYPIYTIYLFSGKNFSVLLSEKLTGIKKSVQHLI